MPAILLFDGLIGIVGMPAILLFDGLIGIVGIPAFFADVAAPALTEESARTEPRATHETFNHDEGIWAHLF
jgi:hypothetical protein